MSHQPQRPRRPLLTTEFVQLPSDTELDPATLHDAAHSSAACLVRAARDQSADLQSVLALAETIGLDEMALLWRGSDRCSLPATLWTLYALRSWCQRGGEEIVRLWSCGQPHAEVSAAVAGLVENPSPAQMADYADALLAGVLLGDQVSTLHRAAEFFRVIATGRADLPDTGHAEPELGFCALSTAEDLQCAARAAQADAWS